MDPCGTELVTSLEFDDNLPAHSTFLLATGEIILKPF